MVYPSWGAGVIYGILYKIGDMFAINLFHKIIFMIFVVLTGRELFKNGEIRLRDLIVFGVLFYNSFFFLDRPAQLAVIPFFLFLKISLNSEFEMKKKCILSALLTILWINIHGSALISPILFYVLNTNKFNLKILFYSFLPLLTLLINPFGWDVFTHAFETSIISKERLLTEWEPVASKSFPLQSLVFFTTIGIIFNRYSPKKSRPPLWIYFLLMVGVTGIRQTVWVAYSLGFWFKGQRTEKKKFALGNPIVLITLNLIALMTLFPSGQKIVGGNKMLTLNPEAPKPLVEKIIDIGENGPIFNEFEFGSYFILKLPNKIFMDSRNIIFPDDAYKNYALVMRGEDGWEKVLDKYEIKLVAMSLKRNRIRASLASSPHWEIIYADKDYFLARRK